MELRLAFCFPDTYEIGMSNLGMSILYQTMNSLPFVWCERVFAPWCDMYTEMKQAGIPLYALESGDPLTEFDSLAFSAAHSGQAGASAACMGGRYGGRECRTDGTLHRSFRDRRG